MTDAELNRVGANLARWYLPRILAVEGHAIIERCELLLAAADLQLRSRRIDAAVGKMLDEEKAPPSGEDGLFYSLARQLVLMRFGTGEDIRKRFLHDWIVAGKFRSESITTIAFLLTLALQQPQLLPEDCDAYVRRWFRRHKDFESDRYAAWSCYCLALAGFPQEARELTKTVLARRNANGSWANEIRRTIGCAYALLLGGVTSGVELTDTLRYIGGRITPGFSNDVATQAQALKVFFLADAVPAEDYHHLQAKVINEGSVFLSHSHQDKAFVRRLAGDLQRAGIRVWLDEAELLPGDSILSRVEAAIEEMQYLAVVLSPASVASAWVTKELRMAQIQELADRNIRVLPILARECQVPLSLRDILWADFTGDYDSGLKAVLRRLT